MRIASRLLAAGMSLLAVEQTALAQEPATTAGTPAPQPVAAAPAPDLVLLKDGSMVRGTIVDLKVGDHVQILTVTGESRSYPMSDVQFAGPASERPTRGAPAGGTDAGSSLPMGTSRSPGSSEVRPKVVVHGQEANASFTSEEPLTFQVRNGSAIAAGPGGVAVAVGYDEICTTPCQATMPAGTHTLALSKDGGTAIEAEAVTLPPGNSSVEGKYESRSGIRVAGWAIFGVGLVGGTAIALSGSSSCSAEDEYDCGYTNIYIGGGIALAGTLVGLVMAYTPDKAEIVVGGAPSQGMRTAKHIEFRGSARGLDLLGTF
jgi:hypothetical protein